MKRERNKPATIEKIKATYGELLDKPGKKAPRKSTIARVSGRSEELIDRYFMSLEGLQRAYIGEQDYWAHIFARCVLEEGADLDDIKKLFTTIQQENFCSFFANKEMQSIITLQISEENEQMTEISAEREKLGELLFAKTDPFFKNTDVCFRSLNSLLLGGVYYVVLHHRNNKSTVCSKNLSMQADREALLKTIGQVMSWACDAARSVVPPEAPDFSSGDPFEALQAAAVMLVSRKEVEDAGDMLLKHQVKMLRERLYAHLMRLDNEVQIASLLSVCLNRLGMICNMLRERPGNASVVLRLIEDVMRNYRDMIPNGVELPLLFCRNRLVELNLVWQGVKDWLSAMKTDPFLLDIISYPLIRFGRQQSKVYWQDYRYLDHYMNELQDFTMLGAGNSIYDTLIGLGYNHVRFVTHYIKVLEESMAGQHPRIKEVMLLDLEKRLVQVIASTYYHFDIRMVPVAVAVCNWIAAQRAKDLLTLPSL